MIILQMKTDNVLDNQLIYKYTAANGLKKKCLEGILLARGIAKLIKGT